MTHSFDRYQRQHQVAQLGGDAKQKFAAAHVLIVGVGGLGSPVSLFLAGAGIGEITLIDPDLVSLSNLHRQILYQENDISVSKVDAAHRRLHSLNSDISINVVNSYLDVNNVAKLVNDATVVVDAADNFLVTYLLSDACYEHKKPLVCASVLGTHGYLGVFCSDLNIQEKSGDHLEKRLMAPSYRAVFPSPPSKVASCDTAGVTGPSVGIIGSYQAQEVLKVIVGDPSQLLGRLMYIDLWDYHHEVIDFNGAREPSVWAEIIDLLSVTKDDVLLDVRGSSEVELNPALQAQKLGEYINLPLDQLSTLGNEKLPLDSRIVCICKSGQRALSAAHWLLNNGYANVVVSTQSV